MRNSFVSFRPEEIKKKELKTFADTVMGLVKIQVGSNYSNTLSKKNVNKTRR